MSKYIAPRAMRGANALVMFDLNRLSAARELMGGEVERDRPPDATGGAGDQHDGAGRGEAERAALLGSVGGQKPLFPVQAPQTVVVVPSLSLDQEELAKISGVHHYEERLLCMLMLLRRPRTNVVFVTSPNNPTGNAFPVADIERILRAARADGVVGAHVAVAQLPHRAPVARGSAPGAAIMADACRTRSCS